MPRENVVDHHPCYAPVAVLERVNTNVTIVEYGRKLDRCELAGVFLPVVTPCYLASSSCMKELNQYLAKVEKDGAGDLILPLMMIDPSATRGVDDRILGKLKSFQYKDIMAMRFMDRGSGGYRKALNSLALGMLRAQRALECAAMRDSALVVADRPSKSSEGDDGGGFVIDSISDLPTKAEAIVNCLTSLMGDTDEIGATFGSAADKITAGPRVPNLMLAYMLELSREIDPMVGNMSKHAGELSRSVSEADPLFRTVLGSDLAKSEEAAELVEGIRALVENAESARAGIEELQLAARDAGKLSRILYRPLKILERSAAVCISSFDVCISWGEFLPEAGET